MHIVIISDFETAGGAGIATSRLAEALTQAQTRITRIVNYKSKKNHVWNSHELKISGEKIFKIKTFSNIEYTNKIREYLIHKKLNHLLEILRPDIINIHNIHGANWNPLIAAICCKHAPVVWTLHDMWSFTGSCAYSYNCSKFTTGCDSNCPESGKYPVLKPDLIEKAWEDRRDLLNYNPDLIAISPSKWLAEKAKSGLWKSHHVEVIPNSIPLEIFKPINRHEARKALNIETTAPILLAIAHNLRDQRKGIHILIKALELIRAKPLALVTIGNGNIIYNIENTNFYHLGYVNNEHKKAVIYSAADLVIHPALVDNLPNTVIEAIACGTPVVAFATGGVPEVVRPRKTGWLVEEVSPKALAEAIELALSEIRQGLDLRGSCRKIAESEYSYKRQAQRYLRLFESLLK